MHFAIVRGRGQNAEPAGTLESRQQFPALGSVVLIHPSHVGVLDVQIHRVAEDQQLNDGRQEQHGPHARLAKSLPKFLANDFYQPFFH